MNRHALGSKYYIGYDLGIDYIGYCVTDEDYNILRYNKRRMIGTRLIGRVETAEKCRNYRTGRRRLARRALRINLLQGLFKAEIDKIDGKFFQKLDANGYKLEDREIQAKYSLFNDSGYTDVDYYREYPTIYHLRKALMEKGSDDVRKLYLAVHHIIKYRGNFLYKGDFGDCADIDEALARLNTAIMRYNESIIQAKVGDILNALGVIDYVDGRTKSDLNRVLSQKGTITHIQQLMSQVLTSTNSKTLYLLIGILGGKINVAYLFGENYKHIKSFSFTENYDEIVEPELLNELEEYEKSVIDALRIVYNTAMLVRLLNGTDTISDAMVKIYEQHQYELRMLKRFIKKNGSAAQYSAMFGSPRNNKNPKKCDCNYTHYIGGGRYGGNGKPDNGRFGDTCTHSEFCAYVLKMVEEIAKKKNLGNDEDMKYIKKGLKNADFMPKIVSKDNSLLPFQLNLYELKRILTIAEEKFEFLKKSDEYGSIIEKIYKLMEFNIPYYVGPVSDLHKDKGGTAWVKRKSYDNVTPWNFEEQVDLSASEKEFITRMTNKCTHLPNAPALAKNSPIYSQYIALNQLNKLKINGTPISVSDKQKIFDTIYKCKKAVTLKHIIDYYHKEHGIDEPVTVTGYLKTLKGSLSTYLTLKELLGNKIDKYPLMTEKIVFLITLHSDNRRAIENIRQEYVVEKGYLDDYEVNKLKNLDYSGWGNLSIELLRGSVAEKYGIRLKDRTDNIEKDVLDIMYETNMLLSEIVSSERFDFAQKLKQYLINSGQFNSGDITYDRVDEADCPISLKNIIWQTLLLTKELVKLMGKVPPAKIFFEDNRSAEDRGLIINSRKDVVRLLYFEAKKEAKKQGNTDFYTLISNMEKDPIYLGDDNLLRSDKNYLYLLQLGRCVYSGDEINLKYGTYDIDHIIPQCLKKDDSLDNRVLSRKDINARKADKYPLPSECRNVEARRLWDNLNRLKLMSDEKYSRLIRMNQLSDDEITKSISHELIETTQAATILKDLCRRWLEYKFTDTQKPEIIFNKLCNVTDFKNDYSLIHSRAIGDYHHALDAYYSIVVGNVLYEKFRHYRGKIKGASRNPKEYKISIFRKAFKKPVYSVRTKRCIWNYNTINVVRKAAESTDYQVSAKVKEGKGKLYDETLYKPKDGVMYPRKETYPYNIKQNGVYKYGGYKGSGTAYFIVVDSESKKGRMRTIEAVPIYYANKIRVGKIGIIDFLRENVGLINPEIAKIKGMNNPIIRINSLIKYDGVLMRIRGASGNALTFVNAMQLYAEPWVNRYIKELSVISDKCKTYFKDEEAACQMLIEENIERQNRRNNVHTDIVILTKEDNLSIYDFIQDKLNGIYGKIPGRISLIQTLKNAREIFISKSLYEQIKILLKLLSAFDTTSAYVDTSNLAGKYVDADGEICEIKVSAHQGKIQVNKNITSNKVTLINQSVSGLREKEVLLNKPSECESTPL